mgnify:FL=1
MANAVAVVDDDDAVDDDGVRFGRPRAPGFLINDGNDDNLFVNNVGDCNKSVCPLTHDNDELNSSSLLFYGKDYKITKLIVLIKVNWIQKVNKNHVTIHTRILFPILVAVVYRILIHQQSKQHL